MRLFQTSFVLLSFAFLLQYCSPGITGVQLDTQAPPFEKLSDYHFFKGPLADLNSNEGVLPYDLNTPLFSDYAQKARFIWMPAGQSASYREDQVLEFPVGTVLIKNFFYENEAGKAEEGRRIIETRLLVHREKAWEAHSYVWNKSQDEANLDVVGDIIPIHWKDKLGAAQKVNYIIPNKNQCKGCHSYDQKLEPIGPKARNLNKPFPYPEGSQNQLEKWTALGYLTGYKPDIPAPQMVQWDNPKEPVHERAMAYLDVNCGHCHNPHGPGGTTGLNLVYEAPLDLNLGINKPPVATGRASGGHQYSIVKGQPEQSILAYRMQSTEPGIMMPELGRTLAHQEGLALIQEWIRQME